MSRTIDAADPLLYIRSVANADGGRPKIFPKGDKRMLESITRNPAVEVLLSGARLVDGEVELSWAGQRSTRRFSSFWLRDHCHAKHSLHPDTLQRQVDTFAIPVDIAPERLEIAPDGGELRIVWRHDGSQSLL